MTDFRLKVRDFYRRNKSKIVIILIIWFVIIVINFILKNFKGPQIPETSYKPHTSIMDNSEVPKKDQEPIEKLIDEYISYGNDKEYEKAYNMLGNECREELYPNIETFKKYIDKVFDTKKTYTIQNYSNVDDTYIYEVNIFEDILATGLTGKDDLVIYSEKFVITKQNNKLSLAIRDFVGNTENHQIYEDNFIKVEITNVVQSYENQKYKVKLTNRTENTIVLADKTEKYEIMLELNSENRNIQNLRDRGIYLNPYESKEVELEFVKFFDENETAKSIIFNAVRVLKSYSGLDSKRQEEMDSAVRLYSFRIEL